MNEKFEYDRELSEDYLRMLMGKAVTRRRTKLIALIWRKGDRPVNVDFDVWKRLEKIAFSRQREMRTELGRRANACQKTLGRTGPLGVHGVREKLQV